MKRTMAMVLFLMAAGVLVPAIGWAADPAGQGGGQSGRGNRGGPADDEMREAIEQLMLVRLKAVLEMPPGQEQRVMPRVTRLQEARRAFHDQRRTAVRHLRALVNDEAAKPGDIEKALRDVRSLESSFRHREEEMRAEIDQELEPRQRARLYFFEDKFRRQMKRRLHDSLSGQAGDLPRAPRAPAAKGAPPDEDSGETELP